MANSAFCSRYHHAVELVGRRWTGALIRALLTGPARFAELRAGIPDISDRMLAERLRELECEGVVERRVIPETPVRVEYELTEKGHDLRETVLALGRWAEKWVEVPTPREQDGARPPTLGARQEPGETPDAELDVAASRTPSAERTGRKAGTRR